MKIYISGKITGLTKREYKSNFDKAEKSIKEIGHEPINPLKVLPYKKKYTWSDYMRADIKALMDCDAVYAMENHKESKGAMIEVNLACDLGMEVYEYLFDIRIV